MQLSQLKSELPSKQNVVGWSEVLQPKIVGGIASKELAFRVYVSWKPSTVEEEDRIPTKDLIPTTVTVDGREVKTDVVFIGPVKALVDRTKQVRPVPFGVSVGNLLISAGSTGMSYTRADKPGVVFYGSNAHVLTSDPFLPSSVIVERRILQPGPYHGGKNLMNIVGDYYWHKSLEIYGAKKAWWWTIIYYLLSLFGQVGGALAEQPKNLIDFAVYTKRVEHTDATIDNYSTNEPFIGHLFAGNDTIGVICKAKNIIAEGYIPTVPSREVVVGDKVKGSSFWGDFTTTVYDANARIRVEYGNWDAEFVDTIFVLNEGGKIRGGWSGSSWRVAQ